MIQDSNQNPIIGVQYDMMKFGFPEFEAHIDFNILLNLTGGLKLTLNVNESKQIVSDDPMKSVNFNSNYFISRLLSTLKLVYDKQYTTLTSM